MLVIHKGYIEIKLLFSFSFGRCLGPYCTVKASTEGRDFQVRSSLDHLWPVFEVHVVFSNSDLTLSSGRQTKVSAMAYIVLLDFLNFLTNNQKGNFMRYIEV